MVPAKSACLCCPSTKPSELHELEARQLRTIVVKHIFEEALVVGDLSERNPNVFYESAAFAMLQKSFSFRGCSTSFLASQALPNQDVF